MITNKSSVARIFLFVGFSFYTTLALSAPAIISFKLNGKAQISLSYKTAVFEDKFITFRNPGPTDSVIIQEVDLPQYTLIHFSLSDPKGHFIQQNFYLRNGDTALLALNKDFYLTSLTKHVPIRENIIKMLDPFSSSLQKYEHLAIDSTETYYQNAELDYQKNIKTIEQLFAEKTITTDIKTLLKIANETDYYERMFYPVSYLKRIPEKYAVMLEKASNSIEKQRQNIQQINSYDLMYLYHDYIRYKLIADKKGLDFQNNLQNYFQAALSSNWKKELVLGYLIGRLDAVQDKSSSQFKSCFNLLKNFAGQAYVKKIDSLQRLFYPIITHTDKILLAKSNGETTTLKAVLLRNKGKITVIDFWASWCVPCRQAFPAFKLVQNKFKNKKVAFVGLSLDADSKIKLWIDALKKEDIYYSKDQFKLKNTKQSPLFDALTIKSIPRYMVLNASGKILNSDFYSPSEKDFEVKLDQYLSNANNF